MGTKYFFGNIGPIKEAEMELGDLTIIAGKNNTGKTYLAYSLYGLLKHMEHVARETSIFATSSISEFEEEPSERFGAESGYGKKLNRGLIRLNFRYSAVNEYMKRRIEMETYPLSGDVSSIFAAADEQFEGANVDFSFDAEVDFSFKGGLEEDSPLSGAEIGEKRIKSIELDIDKDQFRIAFIDNGERGYSINMIAIRCLLILFIRRVFPSVIIQSSERQGISLFYKELDYAKNRFVEKFQKAATGDVNEQDIRDIARSASKYAKPIADDIDFARDLEYIQKYKGQLADHEFFNDIKDMMGGYYRYADNGIQFISKGKGKNGFSIPMHTASSSARGLSDLYFYIKHVAQKGQLLIIDEPESHLDTANQILMARLLARCVNAGIKVLITTHSDYIIKEFNNLIMLSHDFDGKEQFLKRYKREYTENDYLRPESVKGYICEKGSLTECEVIKHGINMPVFDETIRHINDISNILGLSLDE